MSNHSPLSVVSTNVPLLGLVHHVDPHFAGSDLGFGQLFSVLGFVQPCSSLGFGPSR